MKPYKKIELKGNSNVILRATPGHFVTPNAHVNHYIDLTPMKHRISEAKAVAAMMASYHSSITAVDSIVCLDGTEVIGAYLAEDLTKAGVLSMNMHKAIYVLTPEITSSGQMVFRENISPWIEGKNVLVLFSMATTGRTILRAVQTINYYGAKITGISSIFSTVDKVAGIPVNAIFTQKDLPDYRVWNAEECPLCKENKPVEGLWNGSGLTTL